MVKRKFTAGRSANADVVLPPAKDDSISRFHLEIEVLGNDRVRVTDTSMNGTWLMAKVGKIKIDSTELAMSDVLMLGTKYRVKVADLVADAPAKKSVVEASGEGNFSRYIIRDDGMMERLK